MKYFGLIWKNVWRKKIRTSLTLLSVFVAFLLFALLSAIGYAFKSGEDVFKTKGSLHYMWPVRDGQ